MVFRTQSWWCRWPRMPRGCLGRGCSAARPRSRRPRSVALNTRAEKGYYSVRCACKVRVFCPGLSAAITDFIDYLLDFMFMVYLEIMVGLCKKIDSKVPYFNLLVHNRWQHLVQIKETLVPKERLNIAGLSVLLWALQAADLYTGRLYFDFLPVAQPARGLVAAFHHLRRTSWKTPRID